MMLFHAVSRWSGRAGALILLILGATPMQQSMADEKTYPVTLGVDDAGPELANLGHGDYWNWEPFYQAVADLGLTYFDVHFTPVTDAGDRSSSLTAQAIKDIDAGMRKHGLAWTLNLEYPNFVGSAEITPGVNEFAHPDGTHRWDLRMDWLNSIPPASATAAVPAPPGFRGLLYDECEHMLLSNNKFSSPKADFDKPFLASTHGLDLTVAYDKLVDAATRLRLEHYQGRVPLFTEDVWPDLYQLFARAGWNVTPKLLKESFNVVALAGGLGAALEYADRTHFSVSPDLWNYERYPGHSPEALRTALLMGYWTGAESIYVENLDFSGEIGGQRCPRHPDADTSGSLLYWPDANHYVITKHGRVLQDFAKNYVPTHPRPITWRDYRPRVAIVRLPDGGWGQFDPKPGDGEAASRNRLLGNREHPIDEPAREWLHVWPLLTHGAIKDGAISVNNPYVYPDPHAERFVPVDSVAVFDHLVTGPVLDSVECFIVCGHALSEPTFQAISERVRQGATCIIARRLYAQYAKGTLPGDWLVVDSFKDNPTVAQKLEPFLGPADVSRFRFKDHVVEFHKGPARDQVEVTVKPTASR